MPTLDEALAVAKGRILINMDTKDPVHERVFKAPGDSHAAFMQEDNALADPKAVAGLVKRGYIVRSRSDIDTEEARRNDGHRRDVALATGAQVVSTDYYQAPNLFGNDYHVAPFKGGARCNPVTGGAC